MSRPVEVKSSALHGQGIFAARSFLEGETILVIDDTDVVNDPSTLTSEEHDLELDYVDGTIIRMHEPERLINHSCNPTTYIKTIAGKRHVVAMGTIEPGEEITYDYAINGENDGTFPCRCGSKNCRGTYHGNFFALPIERQRQYLPYLDEWFTQKYRDQLANLK